MTRRPSLSVRPSSSRGAFTILEILFGLVLFSLLFGAFMLLSRQGVLQIYKGGDETLATIYASEILETIRGAPFNAFPANDLPMNLEQIFREHNVPEGVEFENYVEYMNVEAKVSPVPGYDPAKIKQVQVVVAWNDRANNDLPKNVRLITFYTSEEK